VTRWPAPHPPARSAGDSGATTAPDSADPDRLLAHTGPALRTG
jgi:hypothetical protein